MTNINDDTVLEFEVEEDSLLFSVVPGPRIFTLNNSSSTTLLGVVLEENDDSFLVGIPSRLLDSDNGMRIEPFVAVPYLRLMKSSVLSVLFLFGVFREKYLPYLIERGVELYPGIADIVDDIVRNEEIQFPEPISSEQEETKEKMGMTDEELKEYLEEKLNKGGIVYGNGSKH